MRTLARLLAAVAVAITPPLAAQVEEPRPEATREPEPTPQWVQDHGYHRTTLVGDVVEILIAKGLRLRSGALEVRADSALVRVDRDEYHKWLEGQPEGLPRRDRFLPDPPRQLSPEVIVQRLESFLGPLSRYGAELGAEAGAGAALLRSIYLEGDITIVDGGVEMLRARSLMYSVPDNRAVMEDVELRLISQARRGGERVLVVRAPRLVKQGIRTTGRDVSITPCTAGKPHFEVVSRQVEIIEREGEFEVRTDGSALALSGRSTIALPDAHFFTAEQSQIPLKSASASYSEHERLYLGLEFGDTFNDAGGALHHLLTGRPAQEFRGDWRLGVAYNEVRGFPLEGGLDYRGGELYEGHTDGFFLDHDGGPNRGYVRTHLDGTLITERKRSRIHSENRLHLADDWRLDLTVFAASDPAVYPEFERGRWFESEIPETSAHLRHARNNRLLTLTGRTNLTSFSYADDRRLAPSFVEEAPLLTYDVFSEPIAAIGDLDVLLTSATSAGWLRHEFDPRFPAPVDDRTFRFDQELELATPFHLGPFAIRPHSSARLTHYDETVSGTGRERWAFDAGISATTRLARTFASTDDHGTVTTVRHSMYPQVAFGHLYQVDGDVTEYHQFDEIDSLNENGVVRVGLLNRFDLVRRGERAKTERVPQTRLLEDGQHEPAWTEATFAPGESREFLLLDLAQSFLPISDRDNDGDLLGLFEYELIWRPMDEWLPIPNFRLLIEGEHDWNEDRLRTFNSALRFGPVVGVNWFAGYRTDTTIRGQLQYGAHTDLLGRWTLMGNGTYDLDRKESMDYGASLLRRDHDWTLRMGLTYSVVSEELRFSINFDPLMGGLHRPPVDEFAGSFGRGPDALLNY